MTHPGGDGERGTPFDACVLAGGTGRRLGGVDKAGLLVGGRTLLDRVLAAVAGADTTVVVGPPRPTVRQVTWTREAPPGAGPLAALAAALAHGHAPVTVVAACDLPFLDTATIDALRAALAAEPGAGAAVLCDAEGRHQPLAAAYDRAALTGVVAALGDVRDRPVRLVLDRLRIVAVPATVAAVDVDRPEDLDRARRALPDLPAPAAEPQTPREDQPC